ncbi:MAG: hypothetical protein O2820_10725 [Planctomycetota bacterium]|nr:hypothetical protein [Planctomycetota bacterium]
MKTRFRGHRLLVTELFFDTAASLDWLGIWRKNGFDFENPQHDREGPVQ